jgi:hypothetical protein
VGESIPASLSYLKLNQTEVNSPAISLKAVMKEGICL